MLGPGIPISHTRSHRRGRVVLPSLRGRSSSNTTPGRLSAGTHPEAPHASIRHCYYSRACLPSKSAWRLPLSPLLRRLVMASSSLLPFFLQSESMRFTFLRYLAKKVLIRVKTQNESKNEEEGRLFFFQHGAKESHCSIPHLFIKRRQSSGSLSRLLNPCQLTTMLTRTMRAYRDLHILDPSINFLSLPSSVPV